MTINGTDSNTHTYLPAHKSLDVKFSFTIAVWVKVDAPTTEDATTDLFSYHCLDTNGSSVATVATDDGDCVGVEFALRIFDGKLSPHITLKARDEQNLASSSSHDLSSHTHITAGLWNHLSLVVDFLGKVMSVYLNGEPVYSAR